MKPQIRRGIAHAVSPALMIGLLVVAAAPAIAGATPPPDTAAVGALTLCNQQGNQITTGSLAAKPAVWRAIDTTAAPRGYSKGGTATLYAFQPRPGVVPAEWSGEQLTASSRYSRAAHPIAAATTLDESLATYLHDYPVASSGLFQLRIYLGAPGLPTYSTQYDASYMQVSNGTWRQLAPGPDNCATAGQAVSLETLTLPKRSFTSKSSARTAGNAAAPTSAAQPDSANSAALGHRPATRRATTAAFQVSQASGSSHAERNVLAVVAIALVIGFGGGALAFRRRP